MPDSVIETAAPAAPAPEAAPSVAPAPAAPETPAPAAEAIAPSPAPTAEQPAPESAPAAPDTLLSEAPKDAAPVDSAQQPADKPEGDAPAEEPKPSEEAPSDEPAPLPAYDDFALPEGVTLEAEGLDAFRNVLGEFERSGQVDHAAMQALGQQLVDMHISGLQKVAQSIQESLQTQFSTLKSDWLNAVKSDPEIGGNRFDTAVEAARNFIRTHGGTDEQQAEFRQLMQESGLGNHPAMVRLLARAGLGMQEGRPLAAVKAPAAPKSKTQTLYGRSM